MFWLYNLLLTLLAPIWAPWMIWRTRQRKEPVNWAERQGNYFDSIPFDRSKIRVWVHAVSVGECVAAMPILREIRARRKDVEIVLTVTTSSGHQTARNRLAGLYDYLMYFPIDVPRFQLSVMQRVQPKVIAVMETELWFNFLWAAETFSARTILVNGRISDRAFPRSKRLRFFYKSLLKMLNQALMQSDVDRERIIALGAKPDTVRVLGNTKFDQVSPDVSEGDQARWRGEFGISEESPTITLGSIRAEEFGSVLAQIERFVTRTQVIFVPRHIERVNELRSSAPLKFRSRGEKWESGSILVLDTYGELDNAYAVADIAVVGGGYANLGGQSIIQPMAWGLPTLCGPHMQNFRDAAQMGERSGALMVSEVAELGDRLAQLLEDEGLREDMSAKALALVRENQGASARYATAILDALG